MTARSVAARPARIVMRRYVRARTRAWPDASRLFAVGERTSWSVDEDARHLEATARRLGYAVGRSGWAAYARSQSVFLTSHFEALQRRWLESSHALATAYLHGRPSTPGYPEFDRAFETLTASPGRFAAIQVTHAEMRDLVLGAGVEASTVHVIPIGVDIEHFPVVDRTRRAAARSAFDLPAAAFVVGSFQKDGVGWGEGLEPKLVKGPDVLVASLARVHRDVPELHVLLTGPARGYVRRELERLGIPYRHVLAGSRADLGRAYHAVDVCLVPSRQDGGPKAVLESMASGIPLVTTRVGQATDLVEHGRTGWLVDVEDSEELARWVVAIHGREVPDLVEEARSTAERYALQSLDHLWDDLLAAFVERPSS
jgi:glycosyltransferase involved in cell wall biosynthesis